MMRAIRWQLQFVICYDSVSGNSEAFVVQQLSGSIPLAEKVTERRRSVLILHVEEVVSVRLLA